MRLGVLRHAMCADESDPCGVYVGTNTGQLFASVDRGEHWRLVVDFLPAIYSVRVVELPEREDGPWMREARSNAVTSLRASRYVQLANGPCAGRDSPAGPAGVFERATPA